jgi:hypothetical protein
MIGPQPAGAQPAPDRAGIDSQTAQTRIGTTQRTSMRMGISNARGEIASKRHASLPPGESFTDGEARI